MNTSLDTRSISTGRCNDVMTMAMACSHDFNTKSYLSPEIYVMILDYLCLSTYSIGDIRRLMVNRRMHAYIENHYRYVFQHYQQKKRVHETLEVYMNSMQCFSNLIDIYTPSVRYYCDCKKEEDSVFCSNCNHHVFTHPNSRSIINNQFNYFIMD